MTSDEMVRKSFNDLYKCSKCGAIDLTTRDYKCVVCRVADRKAKEGSK